MLFSFILIVGIVVLTILLISSDQKQKKYEMKLRELGKRQVISEQELRDLGIPLPPKPSAFQAPPAIQPPVLTNPTPPSLPTPQTVKTEPSEPTVPQSAVTNPPPVTAPQDPVPVQPPVAVPQYRPPRPMPAPIQQPKEKKTISSISFMLAVGVVFIILAGVLLVRTQWESLAAGGRLAVLAAGSVLFFGASALAHKLWKLERTGSAFFILGSAFLPISVWAAGYLELLGKSLSGASNPWLMSISFGIFAIISLLAVRIYKKTGWGVLFLSGLTISFAWLAQAISGEHAYQIAALAVFICAMNYLAKPLSERLPLPISKPLPTFSLVAAFLLIYLVLIHPSEHPLVYGVAGILTAACFLTPYALRSIKGFAAIPVCGMSLYGLAELMHPLTDNGAFSLPAETVAAFVCIFCALCMLLIAAAEKIPEDTAVGFRAAFYLCAGAGLLVTFYCIASAVEYHWLLFTANIILFAATILHTLRTGKAFPKGLAAAEAVLLCMGIGVFFGESIEIDYEPLTLLLIPALLLLFWIPFHFCKYLHTTFADFAFPLTVGFFSFCLSISFDSEWQANVSFGIMLFLTVVFWLLATEHRTRTISQHFFAVFSPLALCSAALLTNFTTFWDLDSDLFFLGWTVLSLGFVFLTYFTTKGKFHSVRKLLFNLFLIPPIVLALILGNDASGIYILADILITAAACLGVWRIFSVHGMRKRSTFSFLCAVLLACEAISDLFQSYVFKEGPDFPVLMFTSIAVLLVGILTIFIRRRTVRFVGDYALSNTARFLMPLFAFILSCQLNGLSHDDWDTFYLLFTLIFCAAGWLSTKRTDFLLPTVCGVSSLIALEAFRDNTVSRMEFTPNLVVWLVGTAVICMLFCGIDILLRKSQPRRALSLSVTGGCTLLWLLFAHTVSFQSKFPIQKEWVAFTFFAILAGFLLHFRFTTYSPAKQRGTTVAAAAALTIAIWLFPLFNFTDTYLDGKAHLLPLLGFALVIRKLYTKEIGSWTLFFVGTYSILALGFQALRSETPLDLLTVILLSAAIFIVSFFVKQKKWFLLGGISLLCIAFYMNTEIFPEFGWWIFLLVIGVILIAIAAINELCKQRGESLKVKAGRFMEDWDW